MTWALVFLLAAGTLAGLLFVARPGRGGLELVAAALLLAMAGYAWQGSPALPGRPTPPRANHPTSDVLFAAERRAWLDRVGPDGQALDAADGLIGHGDAAYAIAVLRAGLAHAPQNMTLWIGLGNALVAYADGSVTPPARYAFDRAAAIAPRHPAPAYLLGLEYAQSGDLDAAEAQWRALLARSPADAPWRPLVAQKLAILARIRAAG
ncbi:tetratricopeptide repeat protein [Sphingomonas nostoxanthinifaciens]|uniref:tetratricopeptide repeat protein n=1 Tax=Sphingomonas nostoxanthinifaciens TaxID=2872652 RepID=UPI001CC1DE15|nr:cytochrome C biogenesis protein [Sphingomonas nostoxanthinifaciens]UAK26349.1 cytochrome C biogenesis protein [Sphingomonas nostoxanthinifaciens]